MLNDLLRCDAKDKSWGRFDKFIVGMQEVFMTRCCYQIVVFCFDNNFLRQIYIHFFGPDLIILIFIDTNLDRQTLVHN